MNSKINEYSPLLTNNSNQPLLRVNQETDYDILLKQTTQFNNEVGQLIKLTEQLGTTKDTENLRKQLRIKREDCANLAKSTMNLMKKTKINKDDKIKFDKLMNQFHEIFNRCQMISKDSIQKERTITLKEPILPVLSTENQRIEENFSENQPVLKQLDFDSYNVERSIMEERNEEIKYLENELKGLNEIFVDVATMIKEQGEQIMTIEQNTEIAASSVEEGVSQLKHASEYQKKSRTKMCCILICILILIAIILLIILMTLKIIPVP